MKTKNKIIIAISVILVLAIIAVVLFIYNKNKQENNEPEDLVVLKENVIVITNETDENLQPYKVDENYLYFEKNPKYQEKEIVVSGITKTAPNGYIRKIVKIEETNGEYVLKTEPATFLDVFEVLHLTATIELTEDENGNFSVDETAQNALSILPKLSLSATNKSTTRSSISKNKDSDNSNDDSGKRKNLFEIEFDEEIDDIVHLQGNASAKVWLELKIDIENNEITWSLTANDEIQSHILIGCGASYDKEFEKELFSKQLPNIQIMAGPVPIVLTNEVSANLEFEAGIAGEIGTSIDIAQTSKNGFVYTSKDGSVKEINDGEMTSGGVECTTGSKATGSAEAGVILSLTTLFYDCSGAELGLGVEASAEGEITLNDKTLKTDEKYYGKLALAISPCVSGNIIVQIPVIDNSLFEMEIFKVDLKPFWEKVWENKNANKVVDVLSKDCSNELWWKTYDRIIKVTMQQQNNEYISWGTLCGAPGTEINIGGVGATIKLNPKDEFVYLLKEVNNKSNNIPELFIGIKNGDSVKIAVIFQFIDNNTPNWGITGPYASTILGVIDDNKDRIELYSNGPIVIHSEYGETVYHDGELDFDYQGNLSSYELVNISTLPWKNLSNW